MAWRSSGSTNATLVANLASNGLIKSERVKHAMLSVRNSLSLSLNGVESDGPVFFQSERVF